jgi:hypothetical protein
MRLDSNVVAAYDIITCHKFHLMLTFDKPLISYSLKAKLVLNVRSSA